jgi:hypothetical protein
VAWTRSFASSPRSPSHTACGTVPRASMAG